MRNRENQLSSKSTELAEIKSQRALRQKITRVLFDCVGVRGLVLLLLSEGYHVLLVPPHRGPRLDIGRVRQVLLELLAVRLFVSHFSEKLYLERLELVATAL